MTSFLYMRQGRIFDYAKFAEPFRERIRENAEGTVVLQNSIAAPAGSIAQYSATIGSLTKISGVQHTTPGSFPHAVRGTLAPVLPGRFTRPLNGTWLISTPGSTPAVQLPAGMIVSTNC